MFRRRCAPATAMWLAALVVACLSSLLSASMANAAGWTAPALLAAAPAALAVLAGAATLAKRGRRRGGVRRGWLRRYQPEPEPAVGVTSGPFGAYRSTWSS